VTGVISRKTFAVFAALLLVSVTANVYFFLPRNISQGGSSNPNPAPTILQKFKASGYSAIYEGTFLIIDAGKDRGVWASNGIEPDFIYTFPSDHIKLKEQVVSGIELGLYHCQEIIVARSTGVPLKVVASVIGLQTMNKLYTRSDSPLKSINDLDGKKIGTGLATGPREVAYMAKKFGIKPEIVPVGNDTANLVALKLGRIDAISHGFMSLLRLADSGELRIIGEWSEIFPKPWAGACVFATDDLIERNPELVRKFVRATTESVKYLKGNPS